MIVHHLPAPQRAFPDGREPAGLVGLAAAAQHVAAGDQRDVAGEETHRLLLEAQLLLRLAVLEVALAERLSIGATPERGPFLVMKVTSLS